MLRQEQWRLTWFTWPQPLSLPPPSLSLSHTHRCRVPRGKPTNLLPVLQCRVGFVLTRYVCSRGARVRSGALTIPCGKRDGKRRGAARTCRCVHVCARVCVCVCHVCVPVCVCARARQEKVAPIRCDQPPRSGESSLAARHRFDAFRRFF